MISPLAGITPTKPSYATLPLPGVQPVLMDEKGEVIEGNGVSGNLCIRFPWPGIIRTTYGDHERCRQNYFDTYKGLYRSEEHTSELQSLMRISYAVFCLKKKN